MNRRKLIAERIVDGEMAFGGFSPLRAERSAELKGAITAFAADPSVQKFVVDDESLCRVVDAMGEDPKLWEPFASAFRAPYDFMWVESYASAHGGRDRVYILSAEPASDATIGAYAARGVVVAENAKQIMTLQLYNTTSYTGRASLGISPMSNMFCEQHIGMTLATEVYPYVMQGAPAPGVNDEATYTAHMTEAVAVDSAFVQLFLTSLNIKNAAQSQKVEVSDTLNHARAKRGKQPLQPYTHIHLLSDEAALTARDGLTAAERAAHMRRGHFKHRKTGVYWWNHHAVGAGESAQRKAYVVEV